MSGLEFLFQTLMIFFFHKVYIRLGVIVRRKVFANKLTHNLVVLRCIYGEITSYTEDAMKSSSQVSILNVSMSVETYIGQSALLPDNILKQNYLQNEIFLKVNFD